MTREVMAAIIAALKRLRASATDESALDAIDLYPAWKPDTAYAAKTEDAPADRVRDEGELYRCEQSHTSQTGWEPHKTPALWTRISLDEWPEWVQPTGAQDAYRVDDKVSHNGKHWVCTVDYCVYEPGVYGWTEV